MNHSALGAAPVQSWLGSRVAEWGLVALALGAFLATGASTYPTYDDGWNLHLLHQMTIGDFSQLWHHGSPLFYLFWWPMYAAGADYDTLAQVNNLVALAGILLLIDASVPTKTDRAHRIFLGLLVCLAPVAVVNRSCFTIEAGGLVLLGLAIRQQKPFWQGLLFGAACLWNYKLGLGGAIWLGWAVWRADDAKRFNVLVRFALGGILCFVACWLVFMATNKSDIWLRPLATYAGLLGRNANPEAANPGLDALFYFYYILQWDNALLWIAGLWGLYLARKAGMLTPQHVYIGAVLLLGIFLPKGPRWLLPILPLLAGQIVDLTTNWSITQLRLLYVFLLLGARGSYYHAIGQFTDEEGFIEFNCFNNSPIHLKRTERFYTNPEADTICTLLSTTPYLYAPGLSLKIVRSLDCKSLNGLPGRSVDVDGYAYLAGYTGRWLGLWPCAVGHSTGKSAGDSQNDVPVLWLEHAEYTGLTYHQTLDRWRKYQHTCTWRETILLY
jgi:hypothetical protein